MEMNSIILLPLSQLLPLPMNNVSLNGIEIIRFRPEFLPTSWCHKSVKMLKRQRIIRTIALTSVMSHFFVKEDKDSSGYSSCFAVQKMRSLSFYARIRSFINQISRCLLTKIILDLCHWVSAHYRETLFNEEAVIDFKKLKMSPSSLTSYPECKFKCYEIHFCLKYSVNFRC